MDNVTDRLQNPFGVRYPCAEGEPVASYGDANADVHLIGDHPGVHGGRDSGVPFDAPAMAPLLAALRAVGLVTVPGDDREREREPTVGTRGAAGQPAGDEPGVGAETDAGGDGDTEPRASYVPRNLFCSYLHACPLPGREPTEAEYARLEPSFDAELRAVAAHVLVPVGDRALAHVLQEYTGKARQVEADAATHHAAEVPGRGFLVVPVREPADWEDGDADTLCQRLHSVLDSDYRRTADLGRFFPGDDAYLVR